MRWSRSLPAELRFADSRFSWAKSVQLPPRRVWNRGYRFISSARLPRIAPLTPGADGLKPHISFHPVGRASGGCVPAAGEASPARSALSPSPPSTPPARERGAGLGVAGAPRARGCPQAQRGRRGAGRPLSLAGTLAGARLGRRVAKGCRLSQPGAGSCPFKNQLAQGVLTCSA